MPFRPLDAAHFGGQDKAVFGESGEQFRRFGGVGLHLGKLVRGDAAEQLVHGQQGAEAVLELAVQLLTKPPVSPCIIWPRALLS